MLDARSPGLLPHTRWIFGLLTCVTCTSSVVMGNVWTFLGKVSLLAWDMHARVTRELPGSVRAVLFKTPQFDEKIIP